MRLRQGTSTAHVAIGSVFKKLREVWERFFGREEQVRVQERSNILHFPSHKHPMFSGSKRKRRLVRVRG